MTEVEDDSPQQVFGLPDVARILRDIVIVVAGILIAFALDAWWEERADRQEERAILLSLKAEFEKNAHHIFQAQRQHERALSASLQLLAMTANGGEAGDDGEETDPAKVPQLLVGVLGTYTVNPADGATKALLQSGKLDLIQNAKLRHQVAAWPGALDDYLEEERRAIRESESFLYPAINELTSIRGVVAETAILPGIGSGQHGDDFSALLASRLFENAVVNRAATATLIAAESAAIRVKIEEIQGLIDAELNAM